MNWIIIANGTKHQPAFNIVRVEPTGRVIVGKFLGSRVEAQRIVDALNAASKVSA